MHSRSSVVVCVTGFPKRSVSFIIPHAPLLKWSCLVFPTTSNQTLPPPQPFPPLPRNNYTPPGPPTSHTHYKWAIMPLGLDALLQELLKHTKPSIVYLVTNPVFRGRCLIVPSRVCLCSLRVVLFLLQSLIWNFNPQPTCCTHIRCWCFETPVHSFVTGSGTNGVICLQWEMWI